MSGYDPELHQVDPSAWEKAKNEQKGHVTIDRWTKDGVPFVSLAYWAYRGPRAQDRYRIHVVAPTLEEAIYRAEHKAADTVVGTVLSSGS